MKTKNKPKHRENAATYLQGDNEIGTATMEKQKKNLRTREAMAMSDMFASDGRYPALYTLTQ